MSKKLFISIMCIFLLLVGCSKSIDKTTLNKNNIQPPSPTLINIKSGTKQLTIDIVKELAKKGENLSADDFTDYIGRDIGSGLYIMMYPIDETYSLSVGYSLPDKPMYVFLNKKGTEKSIDIRRENIDEFINKGNDNF